MRPVKGINVTGAVAEIRPTSRLHGSGDLQRQFVIVLLLSLDLDFSLSRKSPQVSVSGNIIESVIMNTGMGNVGGHVIEGLTPAEVEKTSFAKGIELQK